jgi:hypothetical protein
VDYVKDLQVPYTVYLRYYDWQGGVMLLGLPADCTKDKCSRDDLPGKGITAFTEFVNRKTNNAVIDMGRDKNGEWFVRAALKGLSAWVFGRPSRHAPVAWTSPLA